MQILVACLLVHSRVVFGKSTTLVLGDSSKSGASVESIHTDVSESSAGWSIQTTTTQGFHLKLSMDNTWGFRPGHKSTIQIIIDGDTPLYVVPAPGMPNPDLEALFAASISNQQYIAFEISLDNNGQDNYASPGCSDSTPISMWDDDDVNAIVDVDGGLDRWDTMSQRTRLQNMNGWGTPEYISETIFKPSRDFNLFPQAFAWPLTFTFENDPINDILNASFSTPSWNGFTQYCLFNAFNITNAGLDFFMALDDDGETINYKLFTISESYEQTASPTDHPSAVPSGSPTLQPTPPPSLSPVNPTTDPTHNPTLVPTSNPSLSPFQSAAFIQSTFQSSLNDDLNHSESDSSDQMKVAVTIALIISVVIVAACIAITCALIKLWKEDKKTKDTTVILGDDVGVPPLANNKQIAMVPSADVVLVVSKEKQSDDEDSIEDLYIHNHEEQTTTGNHLNASGERLDAVEGELDVADGVTATTADLPVYNARKVMQGSAMMTGGQMDRNHEHQDDLRKVVTPDLPVYNANNVMQGSVKNLKMTGGQINHNHEFEREDDVGDVVTEE
eukprot:557222_1